MCYPVIMLIREYHLQQIDTFMSLCAFCPRRSRETHFRRVLDVFFLGLFLGRDNLLGLSCFSGDEERIMEHSRKN